MVMLNKGFPAYVTTIKTGGNFERRLLCHDEDRSGEALAPWTRRHYFDFQKCLTAATLSRSKPNHATAVRVRPI